MSPHTFELDDCADRIPRRTLRRAKMERALQRLLRVTEHCHSISTPSTEHAAYGRSIIAYSVSNSSCNKHECTLEQDDDAERVVRGAGTGERAVEVYVHPIRASLQGCG